MICCISMSKLGDFDHLSNLIGWLSLVSVSLRNEAMAGLNCPFAVAAEKVILLYVLCCHQICIF